MTAYILVKYIHFLSIFGMISCLVAELILVKPELPRKEIAKISKVDGLYGLMAMLVVGAGLTLWFGVGKPAEYYNNPVLHTKVGIVILVGLISIVPTVFFIKNRKGEPEEPVNVPAKIRNLILFQLGLLALVPLLATMMAFGLRF